MEGQKKGLIITVVVLFSFIFFNLWPLWLQIATWYGFVSVIIGYFVTIGVRILTGIVMFHFGFDFNLFPNYFNSFVNPKKMLVPVCRIQTRSDFFNPISLMFRLSSASFILFLAYKFCQDEQAMEDLREISSHVKDVFDYSSDWVLGNA